MNYKVSKENFISILVDCRGESIEDAEMTFEEYRGNLGVYISDIGGDKESLAEAKAYFA